MLTPNAPTAASQMPALFTTSQGEPTGSKIKIHKSESWAALEPKEKH